MKTEPIVAMRERIKKLFEITEEDVTAIEANARRNEIIALAAFKKGQSSPNIKRLEWKSYIGYCTADTHLVDYLITPEYGTDKHLLWINKSPISSYRTPDEAKAAAQTDFEQRVMKCLNL